MGEHCETTMIISLHTHIVLLRKFLGEIKNCNEAGCH